MDIATDIAVPRALQGSIYTVIPLLPACTSTRHCPTDPRGTGRTDAHRILSPILLGRSFSSSRFTRSKRKPSTRYRTSREPSRSRAISVFKTELRGHRTQMPPAASSTSTDTSCVSVGDSLSLPIHCRYFSHFISGLCPG